MDLRHGQEIHIAERLLMMLRKQLNRTRRAC